LLPKRISFVCQSGRLEAQSVLLAASLRLHFPVDVTLVAAHPVRHGLLNPVTAAAFEDLQVKIVPIENPLDETYLIGHKIAALRLLDGPDLGLFLDSDILAMRKPEPLSNELAAVPASGQICSPATWRHIYASFGIQVPAGAPATLNTQETTAPYYNSGMIAIPGEMAVRFSTDWTTCARKIDLDPQVPDLAKRPYLDQTSFPLAAAACGQPINRLGPEWNFPSWIWRVPDGSCPIFFHYQRTRHLARQSLTLKAAQAAKSILPTVQQALLSETDI